MQYTEITDLSPKHQKFYLIRVEESVLQRRFQWALSPTALSSKGL